MAASSSSCYPETSKYEGSELGVDGSPEIAETVKDDDSELGSDITGDIKDTSEEALWSKIEDTSNQDLLAPDPFQDQPWYLKDFMVRADEALNPVQTCEMSPALQQYYDGETEFWDLKPHEIEQIRGAGGKFGPTETVTCAGLAGHYVARDVYSPDYSKPLETRLLNLLDHINPGFKQKLIVLR
jgi:hypothetical protein